jgi:NDP-sugar pyrophosphorylase family protein
MGSLYAEMTANKVENIQVAILAGGLGSRLKSVVHDRNKVAAEVAGKPFLTFLLDSLSRAGFEEVVLCSGFMGEDLNSRLGERYKGLQLVYSHEPKQLGTAGALRYAARLFKSDTILVMNGDSYCDLDLNKMVQYHCSMKVKVTIAAVLVEEASRYGRLDLDPGGKVKAFQEKMAHHGAGYVNAGIYIIQRELLDTIPDKRPVSLERDIFPQWVAFGMHTLRHSGSFIDIGTPETYLQAQSYLQRTDYVRSTAEQTNIKYR